MEKRIAYILLLLLFSACGYSPKSTAAANNTQAPIDIVKSYLRALEAGDWEKAEALLSSKYRLRSDGDNWIKGSKKRKVLESYKAWRKAFPRYYFKEELLERTGNGVRLGIYYSGNHKDTLSLSYSGLELIDSTGISIRLPVEYHTYYVEDDRIVFTRCEIPFAAGRAALIEQLTQ